MKKLASTAVVLLLTILVGLPVLACNTSPNTYIPQPPDTPQPAATPIGISAQAPATPRPPDTPLPVPTVIRGNSGFDAMYVASSSLSDLVANSSVIVIGTIPNAEPDDVRVRDQSSSHVQAVGSGYNVQVERYLKGSGGNTIPVVQFYGLDYTDQGQTRQARDTHENLLLGKGSRYLLFLRENGSYPSYWIGTAYPYKFLLSGGRASAESPVDDLDGAFPEQSETDFISSVEAKITASP